MKDHEVKDRLDELNALSGGIVFGKEEAWDKLQARLDKKPAKKIVLSFRLAAAAILLLCVSVLGYYFYPEQHVALNQLPAPAIVIDTETRVVNQPSTTTPDENTDPGKSMSNIVISREVPQARFVVREQTTVVTPAPPIDTFISEPVVAAATPHAPLTPAVKKMRVVHINDLGRAEFPEPMIAYVGPSLDISKMKVVSIYDLQREEGLGIGQENTITIVRVNRPHNTFLSLPNALTRNNQYSQSFAQNPFTIRLNKNN